MNWNSALMTGYAMPMQAELIGKGLRVSTPAES